MVKKLNGDLSPVHESDREMIKKITVGQFVKTKIKRPRNIMHHKKYWALINLIYYNLPEELEGVIKSPYDLHQEIKIQAGYRSEHTTLSGRQIWKVDSISFDNMDQSEFEEFYDSALQVVVRHILPGVTKQDIINQLVNF